MATQTPPGPPGLAEALRGPVGSPPGPPSSDTEVASAAAIAPSAPARQPVSGADGGDAPVEVRISIPPGFFSRLLWGLVGLSMGGVTATGLVSWGGGVTEQEVREIVAEELRAVLQDYHLERKDVTADEP